MDKEQLEIKDEKSCLNKECRFNSANSQECYDCGWIESKSDSVLQDIASKPDESRLLSGIPDLSISFSGDGLDYAFNDLQPSPDSRRQLENWVQSIRREQDAKTRERTLKEVGKFMYDNLKGLLNVEYRTYVDIMISLRKGEMPR